MSINNSKPQASPVKQESPVISNWNFDSAFEALSAPTSTPDRAIRAESGQVRQPALLERAFSQDDEETPKATPATEPGSFPVAFSFSEAIAYLGYAVDVRTPVPAVIQSGTTQISDNHSLAVETPVKKGFKKASFAKRQAYSSDTEAINIAAAKRAEDGRRAVLNNYLGSSPEDIYQYNLTPKLTRPKAQSRWTDENISPFSTPSRAVNQSQQQVSGALAAKKKVQLVQKLQKLFPRESALFMISTPTSQTVAHGIHVFVDMSNILIGFHDALKRSHGVNPNARIRRQTLSFHNLSMILERGRPIAKRFLAGSDEIDCVQEARLLGYTTNILQRVDKRGDSTTQQRFGMTSSESDSATPGKMKRAEQAVDEVLHLGMLQSIVDADVPSTIVLASGDAAQAEFSDGFLAQVERALRKGWKVEVVAFRAGTGRGYRDAEWLAKWAHFFRLVYLDSFVDELHVTGDIMGL